MLCVPEEERFAKNATIMAQAIHEGVKRLYDSGYQTVNPQLIMMAAGIISSFNKHFLIQGFIENSHASCWDKIKECDEQFFVEHATDIFQYLPMDKVNLFKDLFLTRDSSGISVVSQSLKDQIWDLFHAMIKISIKYVHKGRNPYSYNKDNGIVKTYGSSFFEEVDLDHHVQIWGVQLDFPMNI